MNLIRSLINKILYKISIKYDKYTLDILKFKILNILNNQIDIIISASLSTPLLPIFKILNIYIRYYNISKLPYKSNRIKLIKITIYLYVRNLKYAQNPRPHFLQLLRDILFNILYPDYDESKQKKELIKNTKIDVLKMI